MQQVEREVVEKKEKTKKREIQTEEIVNKEVEKRSPKVTAQVTHSFILHSERQKIFENDVALRKCALSSLLSGKMLYEFKKLNIETVEELLWNNAPDIVRKAKHLQLKDVQQILQDVSCKVTTKPVTVYDMFFGSSKQMKLSLGCQIMDRVLNGGVLSKTITEIFGEAGSGKSQVCMQLALQVQMPVEQGGLGGSCLYFNTESDFPIDRLTQMAKYLGEKYEKKDLLSGVLIQSASDLKTLYEVLSNRAYSYIKSNVDTPANVKLIIIDSIAGAVRHHYDISESVERARDLWLLSKKLLQIADEFNIPIVITNQVSDLFSDSTTNGSSEDSPHAVIAALGLSWSNCINSRLFLKKTKEMKDLEPQAPEQQVSKRRKIATDDSDGYPVVSKTPIRELSVVLSSMVSNQKVRFIVTAEGVVGLVS